MPDDIKELIECGAYTEEEALAACSDNGNREKRMVLEKPVIKKVGDEENTSYAIQKFENQYTEEELVIELEKKEEKPKVKPKKKEDDEMPFDEDDDTGLDWLDKI